MKLLLMAQKQIPSSKASCTLIAREWFFFCVRSFVSLEMFQTSKTSVASCAHMGSWFIRFRRRKGCVGNILPTPHRFGVRPS